MEIPHSLQHSDPYCEQPEPASHFAPSYRSYCKVDSIEESAGLAMARMEMVPFVGGAVGSECRDQHLVGRDPRPASLAHRSAPGLTDPPTSFEGPDLAAELDHLLSGLAKVAGLTIKGLLDYFVAASNLSEMVSAKHQSPHFSFSANGISS